MMLELAALQAVGSFVWRCKAWIAIGLLSVLCNHQHQKLKTIDAEQALRIEKVSSAWKSAVESWQNRYAETDAYAKAQQAQRWREVADWQHKYQAQVARVEKEKADYEQIIKRNSRIATGNTTRLNERLHKLVEQAKTQEAAHADADRKCMHTDATAPARAPRPDRLRPASETLAATAEVAAETDAFGGEVSSKYNELKAEYVSCLNKWPQDAPASTLTLALVNTPQSEAVGHE